MLLVCSTALHADTCDVLTCADAAVDGHFNISDVVAVNEFLWRTGAPLGPCVDFDGYDLLTLRDVAYGWRSIFAGLGQPSCVEQPKLIATTISQMSIRYEHIVPPNDSLAKLRVYFLNDSNDNIYHFNLPLWVRVAGIVPNSIEVDASTATFSRHPSCDIDSTAAAVRIVLIDTSIPAGDYTICDIIVRVAPSPILRHVTLEYAELGPYMTGVFEPPNSACNYIMFLDDSLNAWRPELVPTCMCGDADNNGQWTLSDAVYLLVYIFEDRHELTETCRGDANGTGSTNISDVAYLISFLVGGGSTPHCQ